MKIIIYIKVTDDENNVLYYTAIEYVFKNGSSDYLLLVNTNNEFPFK